ncbi:MAG: NAD(+)/NADH kinase [Methanobacteriota archaeon]
MKWGIVCNPNMQRAISLAKDVIDFLKESNSDVYVEQQLVDTLGEKGCSLKEMNKKAEIVITIGGDGTILFALAEIEKPLFSINSGGMGFLSEVESKYAIGGLKRVIAGEYTVEERPKLKVVVDGKRLPDAANEMTVQTAQIAKMLHLQLFVENDLIETMGADGVIIATSTGSTSYALSVGGPLMDPMVNAMIIVPIAAFKLSARPWIIPLGKTAKIKLLPKSKESKIVIDGHFSRDATPENEITVTGSEKKARFIRFGESFYQMVRIKLIR